MFVDELTIHATAGNGGRGVERWLRERYRPFGGPAGGNGGKGGDVFLRGVKDLSLLSKYTGSKSFKAEDGEEGHSRSMHGKDGSDLYIDVPVGSTVTNKTSNRVYEITEVGQEQKILLGGAGGLGNEHFKSSTNRSPTKITSGKKGESAELYIELALSVDVGLVGLPNAGKSTLLNTITNARSEIGSYPFTTTEPHLGEFYGYIIADIPGLIEGASDGKGLGHKFLRHITRTKMIVHLVSLEEDDPLTTYKTIRGELSRFGEGLPEKEEWVLLTKSDIKEPAYIQTIKNQFLAEGVDPMIISAYDDDAIKSFQDTLIQYLRKDD